MSRSSFQTPKGCHVKSVRLSGEVADLTLDCGGGGRGWFPDGKGGGSNYDHRAIKGVRSIQLPGSTVGGGKVSVHFTLVPRHAVCAKKRGEGTLRCKLVGDNGITWEGARRRR